MQFLSNAAKTICAAEKKKMWECVGINTGQKLIYTHYIFVKIFNTFFYSVGCPVMPLDDVIWC